MLTKETKYGTATQLEQFSSPAILSPLGGILKVIMS